MIRELVLLGLCVVIAIVSVGLYLSPDNLAGCGESPSSENGCRKADAIVAVSGGDTRARTREAIELYHNGWADTLILSGAAYDKTGPSNASVMRKQALDAGVPAPAIITDAKAETTRQNAQNANDIFTERKIRNVIVVTSAYHQRRAGLEFMKRTRGEVMIRNHPVAQDNQWSGIWWLTPIGWWLAIGELVKIGVFYTGGSQ